MIGDRIWNELVKAGKGPALVQVSLHRETIARLDRERAGNAPTLGVHALQQLRGGERRFCGFLIVEDPLVPEGAIVIRQTPEPKP